jgi:hypothetical protein
VYWLQPWHANVTKRLVKTPKLYVLAAPSRDDVRSFQSLRRLRVPIGAGGVICLVADLLPLTADTHAIPAGAL